jgi:hypothetical protein
MAIAHSSRFDRGMAIAAADEVGFSRILLLIGRFLRAVSLSLKTGSST